MCLSEPIGSLLALPDSGARGPGCVFPKRTLARSFRVARAHELSCAKERPERQRDERLPAGVNARPADSHRRKYRCSAEVVGWVPTTTLSIRNKVREQKAWNSLNQLISLRDEKRRHFETKRFGGLEIDHQLELRRLLDG